MPLIGEAFSSAVRPVLRGQVGAVSAAHPLAVSAGQEMLARGGSAADAAIAAQAVLCVLMPDACGLGGDMLALVQTPGAAAQAVNGTGAAPMRLSRVSDDGPDSITVPGIVDGWCCMSRLHGLVPLAQVLEPAMRLARSGIRISASLSVTVAKHRERLLQGGAGGWGLLGARAGDRLRQPELGALLECVGSAGRAAFYEGAAARRIAHAIGVLGGALDENDLAAHETVMATPIATCWDELTVSTQPPMTQGILLNMSVQALSRLPIDLERASNRGGPRAYLHTAGVACADAQGMVVSSLVSVFDDFGSCVFVPELGITLNNRAGGFTAGANSAASGKRPVHTLAPVLLQTPQGTLALATPGADGQVQTLLQVLMGLHLDDLDLAQAIARPRWRSENGVLLIEQSHAAVDRLRARGHRLTPCTDGDLRFGSVVSAGHIDGEPIAVADWRRLAAAGVA